MPPHNGEGSIGDNYLNKSMRGNSLWWIAYLFYYLLCVLQSLQQWYLSWLWSNWYAHCYWQKPFVGSGCKNIVKHSVKSYQSSPSMTWKFFISCRLKIFHFSTFHLTSTFGDWSQCFFQQLNCFMICDSRRSVNVYFPLTPTICYTIWKYSLNTQN